MNRRSRLLAVTLLLLTAFSLPVFAEELWERIDGGFYTLFDEAGEEITKTARILGVGDRYIDEDNRHYEVTSIDGDKVNLKLLGTIELPDVSDIPLTSAVGEAAVNRGPIGIYHTHSDESYVPNSGTASEEMGDIYEVGQALKEALEKQGYEVIWSKNNHNPHDAEAYSRSRRTVADISKERPVTVVDIHRDAVPAELYKANVSGEEITKVRLVVGRQNQNREVNLEYAKRIKAIADKHYPGLIKGIFDARGNYNQDLGAKMVLIEVGAHENTLEAAKRGVELFAKVLPAAAGMTSSAAGSQVDQRASGASMRTLWWVLGIAAVVVVGYVLLNGGGLGSITGFFRRETGKLGGGDDSDDPDKES